MQEPALEGLEPALVELQGKLAGDAADVEESHWVVGNQRVQHTQVLLSLNAGSGTSYRLFTPFAQAKMISVRRGVWPAVVQSWLYSSRELMGWISNRPRILRRRCLSGAGASWGASSSSNFRNCMERTRWGLRVVAVGEMKSFSNSFC
jgi:hypothetical protein